MTMLLRAQLVRLTSGRVGTSAVVLFYTTRVVNWISVEIAALRPERSWSHPEAQLVLCGVTQVR